MHLDGLHAGPTSLGPASPPSSALCVLRVLVLEYVKDLEDAYSLLEVLQEQQVPLLQVRPACRAC